MTRPARSVLQKHAKNCALVLEGSEVKARLIAERFETNVPVHVDWVRFTCQLRNAPMPPADVLFPPPVVSTLENPLSRHEEENGSYEKQRFAAFLRKLHELPNADFSASAQAMELAKRVAQQLGDDFLVALDLRKGHDFYKYRWGIERNGVEVGWVGFLASGESPRQQSQAKTLHVNLYGSACTFAQHGWRDRLADLIDDSGAKITRCDLALDFFNGLKGGMQRVKADYENGLCDVAGKRPKCNMVGDWTNGPIEGKGRSFYIGSKEAGKQTNLYEKGHQLFGDSDESGWIRAELRWGNKLRVLHSDMLRRPQDFFAGASDWHAALLLEAQAQAIPQGVPCNKQLAVQTVEAEVARAMRYAYSTAGQILALFFKYATTDQFMAVVEERSLPARLRRYSTHEIASAFKGAANRVLKAASAGHAFA